MRLNGREFDSPPPWGWVTVFVRINHLSISPSQPGQLSLLPSVEREMSTSQTEVMFCGPGVKAYSTSDERLPERLRDDVLIISGVQIRFILAEWYL